ncbi:hypothetical protein AB0A98_06560 [Streptomyces chrestomyceticus]|uniref:hypothetical protein n=1 Tax=Streptomyces chrestomyceticus TaxID=68185 RepID=UPI0033F3A861
MRPDKPALPEGLFDPFLRVRADTSTSSAFTDAHRIATRAATGWMLGRMRSARGWPMWCTDTKEA